MTSSDPVRAGMLLDLAMRHAVTIKVAIDQLTTLGADAELHCLSVRLLELAFRAEPESKRRDMGDAP